MATVDTRRPPVNARAAAKRLDEQTLAMSRTRSDYDFQPLAGSGMTQSPPPLRQPAVNPEPREKSPPRTVRRGHHDTCDFPPGCTLSRTTVEGE